MVVELQQTQHKQRAIQPNGAEVLEDQLSLLQYKLDELEVHLFSEQPVEEVEEDLIVEELLLLVLLAELPRLTPLVEVELLELLVH